MSCSVLNSSHLASLVSPAILDLHILPTEQCNFRCTYCYEDFKLGRMSKKTVNAVKQLIIKRQPLKQLRLSWFGGEPLAALDTVLEISQFAKTQMLINDGAFNFGMTTNGYLLNRSRLESLIAAGVTSFQISLDGPESLHDKTRLRADGAGTFNRIWENLLYIASQPYEVEIILRLHITPDNFKSMPLLIAKLNLHFSNDPRFSVFLKPIANLGGPNTGQFDVLRGLRKEAIVDELQQMLSPTVKRHELNKVDKPYVCYAAAANAWVIRANGALAKCTVMFTDPRNHIGWLQEDGSLKLEPKKLKLWSRGLKANNVQILACPAANLPKN